MKLNIFLKTIFIALFALTSINVPVVQARYSPDALIRQRERTGECVGSKCLEPPTPPKKGVDLWTAAGSGIILSCNASHSCNLVPNPNTQPGTTGFSVIKGNMPVFISGFYQAPSGLWYPVGNVTVRAGNNANNPPPPNSTSTPSVVGTIRARAVTLPRVAQTCDDIKNATDSAVRNNTQFTVRYAGSTVQQGTQTNGQYVSFSLPPLTYSFVPQAVVGKSARLCLTDTGGEHFGNNSVTVTANSTSTYDVSYGPIGPWFQAQGGDAYSANSIISAIGSNVAAASRYISLESGGVNYTEGLITYGGADGNYDFDTNAGSGANYASVEKWLVNESPFAKYDLYQYFFGRFGNPSTPDTLTLPLDKPAVRATAYYLSGDVSTSSTPWVIHDGESYVFLIDGNLTINAPITLDGTGTGFITFIVKGNTTIADSVGGAFNSTTPVVEGVYINGGLFNTGTSSVSGSERFVGKGLFIADNFGFHRDFVAIDHNDDHAAQLFIYNPKLVWEMPDAMKEVGVTWQEVEP